MNRNKKEVWSYAAHDLTTPLLTISMAAKGLKSQPDFLPEAINIIAHQADYCRWYIEIVTAKVKPVTATLYPLTDCSITSGINAALAEFFEQLDINNESHDFVFTGNEKLFKLILFNLLLNAEYAIRCAGKGKIYLTTKQEQDFNYLYFKDTALGIASENSDNVFDEFYTSVDTKMGLGLSFCKKAVQFMGGDITCQARLNEFTEFVLRFPK